MKPTAADDYTITDIIEAEGGAIRRLTANDGSGDWFLLSEIKTALRKPSLKTIGEYRIISIWYGAAIGAKRFRLIRPAAVLTYAREFSERPAAWWRDALHI